jgi:hypothetical protein
MKNRRGAASAAPADAPTPVRNPPGRTAYSAAARVIAPILGASSPAA